MKFLSFKFFLIFFISLMVFFVLYVNYGKENKEFRVYSPLPDFLTFIKNNQVSTLNLYLPKIEIIQAQTKNSKPPIISAKSAFVYDLSTQKTLYAKNINEKLPMASLTKIMTAIIAMENSKSDFKYKVSKENLVGEDSMGLSEGELLSLEELMYGLLLPSGNDAAEVLAANYPKGREEFIKDMNKKAEALGVKNTHYTNPSGLQGDGEQYSTAYDLFIISNYAINNFPLFKEVVSTFSYNIPSNIYHKAFYLENETNLLTSYPGVKGIKTGYTPEAGLCLITYLEYNDHKIIGVILGSNNRRQEMRELLDYSLKLQGITPPKHR